MAKQKFSEVEKASFLFAHNRKCAYCNELLSAIDLHLDHVIPQRLENRHDERNLFLSECRLRSDFKIKSYENILPSHHYCNNRKGGDCFSVNSTVFYLEIASRYAPKIRKEIARLKAAIRKELDSQWAKMIEEERRIRAPAVFPDSSVGMRIGHRPRNADMRSLVIANYGARCAFTGLALSPLLEVASIQPFSAGGGVGLDNAILLSPNMHYLFDRGLIAVDPDTFRIEISTKIAEDPSLSPLSGRHLAEGVTLITKPSRASFAWHYMNVFAR